MSLSPACQDEAKTRTAGFPKSARRLHGECDARSCDCPNPHTPREDNP